jgi:hypothetical protein
MQSAGSVKVLHTTARYCTSEGEPPMKRSIGFVVLGLFFGVADLAHAQTGGAFGIGPRVTFQTGDDAVPDSSALRLFGGQVKLRLNPSTAIEVSADYESELNESLTQRAKTMPIQASLLFFPIRTVVSPYLLGGIGWYRHSLTETTTPSAVTTISIREMGYHAGLGAEVRLGQRMAIHGDYRYNHIRFGGASTETEGGTTSAAAAHAGIPSGISALSAIQESLKLSRQGTMWNWGLTFFF